MDFSYILDQFYAGFSSALSSVSSFLAFDISSGLVVTLCGYTFDASFSKGKPSRRLGMTDRFSSSLIRGIGIKGAFISIVNFLQLYLFDILISSIVSFILVALWRYLIKYFFYSYFYSGKIKKSRT
jgi:hypothetical protein